MEDVKEQTDDNVHALVSLRVADDVEQYERILVREGIIPDPAQLPLQRHANKLAYLHAIPLALIAALMALVLNFIIFNKVLHFGA